MGSRWLITGAQGFVGRYVSAHILASEPDATVFGIGRSVRLDGYFSHNISVPQGRARAPLPEETREFSGKRYRYNALDVRHIDQMRSIMEAFQPHFVVHLASGLRGDRQAELRETNVKGTEAVLRTIASCKAQRPTVVVGSSGGVYGEVASGRLPLRESESCSPLDPYCASKLAAEQRAHAIAGQYGIRLAIARIFNVVGAGQDERHVAGRMAAQLTSIKRGWNDRIRLGPLHCTRDFIDVRDVARALVTIARSGQGIFNIGTGVERSIDQVLQHFLNVSGLRPQIEEEAETGGGVLRNYADITRMRSLGFKPAFVFRRSVSDLLEYYDQLWEPASASKALIPNCAADSPI